MARLPAWLQRRPTLSAALILLALSVIFMGRTLIPPSGMVLGGLDLRNLHYPAHQFVRESLWSGQLPLWDSYRFAGFPFLIQPQQMVFYPPAWPMLILPINLGISLFMLWHIWAAGFGMFVFTRFMGARWVPALLAAILFTFSGFLGSRLWAGHNALYAVDSYAPWLLLAAVWCVRRRTAWAAIFAGLPLGLAILAGHLPSVLYLGILWGAFVLYLLIAEPTSRLIIIRNTLIMGVAGLGIAAAALLPFVEYMRSSARVAEASFEFATNYSLPTAHLMTLLLPEFFGEPTKLGYWSVPAFEELTYYVGLLPVFGFVLALRKPTKLAWFYIGASVFGVWLALGNYSFLYGLFYEYVPIFRVVRAPGRAAFLYTVAAPALLAHALTVWQTLPSDERNPALARLFKGSLLVGVLVGVAALAGAGSTFMSIHPTDKSGRFWHQVSGYSVALVIFVIGGLLLWAYLRQASEKAAQKLPLQQIAVIAALVVLTLGDTWHFGRKFLRLEPVAPSGMWWDAKAVLGDAPERVLPWGLDIFDQNGAGQVKLYSVFGYDSLEPGDHKALTASVADPRAKAYDLLGVRYVVSGAEQAQFTEGERPLTLLERKGQAWVYERASYLPMVRFVDSAEIIPDSQAAIERINSAEFNPATTAIVNESIPCLQGDGAGSAEISDRLQGYWQIETTSSAESLLIIAESNYPGWKATVDGIETPVYTAYTTLKALCVPAGTHTVALTFAPTHYIWGVLISTISVFLVLLGWEKTKKGSD